MTVKIIKNLNFELKFSHTLHLQSTIQAVAIQPSEYKDGILLVKQFPLSG